MNQVRNKKSEPITGSDLCVEHRGFEVRQWFPMMSIDVTSGITCIPYKEIISICIP